METDPFAIHVSGLDPETTTEDELIRYFGKHGRVISASVHVKASRGGKHLPMIYDRNSRQHSY
jgi:RNA recognition motif-containing protein